MTRKRIAMDEHALAEGSASPRRLPEVDGRVLPAGEVARQRAERRLVALADKAVGLLSRAMDGPPTEATLAAARVVLDLTLGEPGAPESEAGEHA